MIKIIKEPEYDGYELKCKKCKTEFRIKFDASSIRDYGTYDGYCYCPKCDARINIHFWNKKIYEGDWSKND